MGGFEEASVCLALARTLSRRRDRVGALREATKACDLVPNLVSAQRLRAIVLTEMGRHDLALEVRSLIIKLVPDDPDNYLARAIHFSQIDQPQRALQDMAMVSKLRILTPADLRTLIILYTSVEDYSRALAAVEAFLALVPNDSGVLFRKAKCLQWLGRLPEALLALTDCLSQPMFRVPALQLRMKLNETLFNQTGCVFRLIEANEDAIALQNLQRPPLPANTNNIARLSILSQTLIHHFLL